MDSNEEFVVVNEESDNRRESVARLDILVDLFKKTIETLNQSSILLKDELQTALSVTLQNVTPDHSSTVEDLVKQLDNVSVSPDNVRKTYVKQLCSRLVAVNEEKQFVMTELVELNDQLRIMESEARKWKELIGPITKIAAGIKMLESKLSFKTRSDTENDPILSYDATVDDLCDFLNAISDRIDVMQTNEMVVTEKVDKCISNTDTKVCFVEKVQTSSDKQCASNANSSGIQTDSLVSKSDACLQAEILLPPMISSDAVNHESPAYANFSKEMTRQTFTIENVDLKELVREEVLRILSDKNQQFSTLNMVQEASIPVDTLLAPVTKTPPTQRNDTATSSLPNSLSILNLWPHLSVGGVSSKNVPPPLTTSDALINPSREVTETSIINENNSNPSAPEECSELCRNGGIPSEFKTLMPSFLSYIGGFVRRQMQQSTDNQNSNCNYGSWLGELGLDPCEETFNRPIERPSIPSFSADEEQPWCPGCHHMFVSRAELEDHFNDCLI
ncbi:hypothetical protein MN116_003420 [Schistosoma mekongi]|uniref:Uncharacterized protein n=1 Tax=Schistosoma mekongi TaxID=38744 RepID=A0AAE2D8L4_SCHME|nr:hypothetical protein MN116_003420 [Schistosoma mekongi]